MACVAVYSLKGGVGKTTLSVNLAYSAAAEAWRKTLLWDLDPQAGATFLIGGGIAAKDAAQGVFAQEVLPERLIRPTAVRGLDLLPADSSLRTLDRLFFNLGRKRRLAKLLDVMGKSYQRIILDCPPGLTETSEEVMQAADLIIAPVIPSPLSRRAFDEVVAHIARQNGRHAPILPVHVMVDRRRNLHLEALARHPDWPVIPMASAIERIATERAPVGAFAPSSPAAQAFAALWRGVEKKLATLQKS